MINYSKSRHIFTQEECFEKGVMELLQLSKPQHGTVARITIFGKCSDDNEYEQCIAILDRSLAEVYPEKAPVVSFVTQPLLEGGSYVAEVQSFDIEMLFKELNGVRYLSDESEDMRRLIICGVTGDVRDSIREQSDSIFKRVGEIFSFEGFEVSDIFKQWNYIPQITAVDKDNYQHYQAFNDSRTEFYRKGDWSKVGYPAATGIGMDCGAVTVDIIAVKTLNETYRVIPIDNDLQQAAHVYSQGVLIGIDGDKIEGKSTPKFERAKALGNAEEGYICFISGTAAIRGEESMEGSDAAAQTIQTMENIEHLISDHTCKRYGIELSTKERTIDIARAYVKFSDDTTQIKSEVSKRWHNTQVVYLLADVCREELLVEIEAISTIPL